jgi:hypothetical protein
MEKIILKSSIKGLQMSKGLRPFVLRFQLMLLVYYNKSS